MSVSMSPGFVWIIILLAATLLQANFTLVIGAHELEWCAKWCLVNSANDLPFQKIVV